MTRRLLALVFLASLSARAVQAQTPYLVDDVDPAVSQASITTPQQLTVAGNRLYAFADTDAGRGLYRVDPDGTTTLLRELSPVPNEARSMIAVGERAYFIAQSGLWTSDGTTAGTTLVRAFPPPGGVGGSIAQADGVVYFSASTGSTPELWKSDGSSIGTVRVASADVREPIGVGSRLFFVSGDQALWTSDGTEAGTVRLGSMFVKQSLPRMIAYGDVLLFIGGDAVSSGGDLWRSDGTEAGTFLVKAFAPPTLPRGLTAFGAIALLGASDGLWRTDGTEAGTLEIEDDIEVRAIHAAPGTAYVHGRNATYGNELWFTDGTAAGTTMLDGCYQTCSFLTPGITFFGTLPGAVAFTRGAHLWRTDATAVGTTELAVLPGSATQTVSVYALTTFGSSVYLIAGDGAGHDALWKTDGTAAGTVRLTRPRGVSSSPTFFGAAGARAVFTATRPDVGREVWSTTGTAASTSLVELTPGPTGTEAKPIASLGGRFLFGTVDGLQGAAWSTDGTAAGTRRLTGAPVNGESAAANGDLAVFVEGNTLYAVRTDGTPEGTFPVPPPAFAPPNNFQSPENQAVAAFGRGFATASYSSSTFAAPIWLTDGSRAPSLAVEPGPGATCGPIVAADDRLFLFCGISPPFDLRVSDGTQSGTHIVAALPAPPLPGLVAMGGRVYFRMAGAGGSVLWSSDGTSAGTGPFPVPVTNPQGLTVSNGLLYFAGTTAAEGTELWRTDGTAAGTLLLRDVDPGPASGVAATFGADRAIEAAAGGVLFAAGTGAAGSEPWWSDGTPAGTRPLPEISPGPASSAPAAMRRVGARVYFAATDPVHGREPWAIDAPASVSVGGAVVDEGDGGTTPAAFTMRLEPSVASPVTVGYATAAGSAQAGSDFVAAAGVVTFPPGSVEVPVEVPVVGDGADETNETFTLRITSAAGATVGEAAGTALILDDDAPRVAVAGASVTEGDAGAVNLAFPVTLTTEDGLPSAHAVTVRSQVIEGTAGADDFPPPTTFPPPYPTVSFAAGTPSGATLPLVVPVLGDTLEEPNETFQVQLDAQQDGVVPAPAVGVILDDDGVAAAAPVEVAHGSTLRADLAPPAGRASDVDFYVIRQQPYASYEIVADELSGAAAPLSIERVAPNGVVVQTATSVGTGGSVAMRWFSLNTAAEHLRVRGAACGTGCGPDDRYRLRAYETTLGGARVNNTGTQATVVVLQNTTASTVAGSVYLWLPDGSLFLQTIFQVEAHGTAVVDTTVNAAELSGSVTVTHDAPYGGLVGKAVSLDPSTGFSFDAPLASRPR